MAVDPLLDLVGPRLAAARWFGGKGRPAVVESVVPLPWLTVPGRGVEIAVRPVLAVVRYDDVSPADASARELYQLVLGYGPERPGAWGSVPGEDGALVWVADVADDPAAAEVLWESLRTAPQDPTAQDPTPESPTLHVERLGAWPAGLTGRRFAGEQSNTSLLYGDAALVKLFRKVDPGRNLDIEVHRALTERGSTAAARLLGAVSVDPVPGVLPVTTDLVMVVEQLHGAVDGWQAALDALRSATSFAAEARELGAALGRVHAALAAAFGTSRTPGADLAATWTVQADGYAATAPALRATLPGLHARFAEIADRDIEVQRVHGDCHLGQALLTDTGWKIIDFEGEPVKPLAERARHDSVWRDVAGLIRSFDYAVATVTEADPGFAADWFDACRDALRDGYQEATGTVVDTGLLAGYEADRAAYEVVYETRNRPDWAAIPLRAVERLAGDSEADRRQA